MSSARHRSRQLIELPGGESVVDYREPRHLENFFVARDRLTTGCRLKVSDFHQDGDETILRLHEKGPNTLESFKVWTDEAAESNGPVR